MKKNSGRILAYVLVMVLMLSLTVGCGGQSLQSTDSSNLEQSVGSEGTAEETTQAASTEPARDLGGRVIKYGAYYDAEPKAGTSAYADKVIERTKEMEEKYNFKFSYVNIPYDQYMQKVTASIMAGEPVADIMVAEDGMFYPGLVAKGLLYPAGDLKEFDFNNAKWEEYSLKIGAYNGKVYGFNYGYIYPRTVMLFNRSLFEREGVALPYELQKSGEWTWENMLEIAKKVTKDTNGDGITDQWGISGIDSGWMLISSNGGCLTKDVDGKKTFALNDENSLEALQFYQDICVKYKVYDLKPDGAEWDYGAQQFQDGKVAMFMGQFWMISTRFMDNMKDDYGVLVFPKGPKAAGYRMDTTETSLVCFPHNVKNPNDVAFIWNEYTEPFPEFIDETGTDVSYKKDYVQYFRDEESMDTLSMMFSDSSMFAYNPIRSYPDILNLWYGIADSMERGTGTPKEKVNEIAQNAQGIIDDVEAGAKK